MGHHHHHTHSGVAVSDTENAGKAFLVSIALNVLYIIAEVTAGLVYDSLALLSDAGHNISDVASLLLSLVAFRLARKRSTKRFTYGYKKTTILAALANAVILLVAIGVLGYEVIRRITAPVVVQGDVIAWVAGLGIIINAASAFLFFKRRKSDLNIRSAYLHLAADALVSLGVVVAGIIISFTGWFWLDPVIGLVVLAVILVSTWHLLSESFKLSLDAVPEGISFESIKDLMLAPPDVEQVHHIHIWAMSTTENALTAHVVINKELGFSEKVEVVKMLKKELAQHGIGHATIEIEDEDNESL